MNRLIAFAFVTSTNLVGYIAFHWLAFRAARSAHQHKLDKHDDRLLNTRLCEHINAGNGKVLSKRYPIEPNTNTVNAIHMVSARLLKLQDCLRLYPVI